MAVAINTTLGILSDNLKRRGGALPISQRKATQWAKGLKIPLGGETVLYTGQMYQIAPAIDAMAKRMDQLNGSRLTRFAELGRALNKMIDLTWFMGRGDPQVQKAHDGFLRNIAHLLRAVGVEFGYLYAADLYSGALLYDEGVDDVFANHAIQIYRTLQKNGTKSVITVDPHTTNMLRSVYPKIISGYELEVKSYLEVLAEHNFGVTKGLDIDLTIHDSCIYARHEKIIDEPRLLLANIGARVHEPEFSSSFTYCCGGPLESLFPNKSHGISAKRVEQLASLGQPIVTMCPVCMASLKRSGGPDVSISDISEHLFRAYYEDKSSGIEGAILSDIMEKEKAQVG